jgi:hypothetical protein
MADSPIIDSIHPEIVLDGKTYSLIFDNSAYVTLHEMGVEIEDIFKRDADGKLSMKAAELTDRTLKLIAAGISHQVELTPKRIGRMTGASEPSDIPVLMAKISEALVKAAGRVKAGNPVAQSNPQPLQ